MEDVEVKISIIRHSQYLPHISADRFFQSAEYFVMSEKTPGCTPLMAVAIDAKGQCVGQLLAVLYRRGSLIPPYLFSQGLIMGEGCYESDEYRKRLFPMLLKAITEATQYRLCLYTELIEPSSKMFGYRTFRQLGFFPISWMHIHNSLHSMNPEDRLTEKMRRRIKIIGNSGLHTREALNEEEISKVHKLFKQHYRLRPWRMIPKIEILKQLNDSTNGRVLVTLWHDHIIGGAVMAYSGSTAYLWYIAARDKSHPMLHPRMMTMWACINQAYHDGMDHILFLNVGLPFRANRWREFILSFGGKSVGTYRWFRFNLKWLNKLMTYLTKE